MRPQPPIEIRERIKTAEKVLESLIFNKMDIPYDIKMEYDRFNNKWYMTFWVDVDVDRFTGFTTKYDPKYEEFMQSLDRRIPTALRYVNLQEMYGGVMYDYYNDDEVESIMNDLTNKLYGDLENLYNVRPHEAEQSDIYYYYYKPSSDELYTRIELLGDSIVVKDEKTGENLELVTCSQLEGLMYDIIEGYIPYDIESFVCN